MDSGAVGRSEKLRRGGLSRQGVPHVGATGRVRVGTLSEGISGGIVLALKDRGLFPRWRVPRFAVAENFYYVFGEVWIEGRSLAGFFFMRFGQCDALGDAATHRLGGTKDSYWPLAIFDDDLRARANACHQSSKVARRFRLRDVNYVVSHDVILPRRVLDIGEVIGNNVPDEFVFHAAGGEETWFERCSIEQVCGCEEGSCA